MPHVDGNDDGVLYGVKGQGTKFWGVVGLIGTASAPPAGTVAAGVVGVSTGPGAGVAGVTIGGGPGVYALSDASDAVFAQSQSSQHAALRGYNGAQGLAAHGVWGESQHWEGVHGLSHGAAAGVAGFNVAPQGAAQAGVWGESQHWEGVHGLSHGAAAGVAGFNAAPQGAAQAGVWGESQNWEGVHGLSHGPAAGVWGESQNWEGVHGLSQSTGAGVSGHNDGPPGTAAAGVWGESQNWEGVHGLSHGTGAGVAGFNDAQANPAAGVWGESQNWDGVHGVSRSNQRAGVWAVNDSGGFGIWAQGKIAGHFAGPVEVDGTLTIQGGGDIILGDFAEDFAVEASEAIEPGTVMVLDEKGVLRSSDKSYDRKVAGVISGAGEYKPGLILDRQKSSEGRLPLALVGKVYCKVNAAYGPIEVGDLLTTSPTLGHAMKADDPVKAFGAVIGKALRSLRSGQGLIPILIALQ